MEDFQNESYVKAARAKLARTLPNGLPENFFIYQAEWLGDYKSDNCVMKLTGAVFRKATRGPRKGLFAVKMPGAPLTVFLSPAEVKASK